MSPVHFVFTCCLALTALFPARAEDDVPMRTELPETLLVPVRNGWVGVTGDFWWFRKLLGAFGAVQK